SIIARGRISIGVSQVNSTLPNGGNGIHLSGTASATTIGGTANQINTISGNQENGILIDAQTSSTRIEHNLIGQSIGNQGDGMLVLGKGVQILGDDNSSDNEVVRNGRNGIEIRGSNASGISIQGFRIAENSSDGILITSAANVTVGGSAGDASNVVVGN